MSVTISVETPLQDDVRGLVDALNAFLLPQSPIEFQFKMTVEQMAEPDTTLFVARDAEGACVGMGALKAHGEDFAEVKRMFTLPAVRGQRVGVALLKDIVDLARKRGVKRLALETGTHPNMAPAWRLYERAGFTKCGAFLDYPESEHSAFYELNLTSETAA